MTLLIVNPVNDFHCKYMVSYLERNGIPHLELESPLHNDYALENHLLRYNGRLLEDIQAVFFRGVMTYNPDPLSNSNAVMRFTDNVQFASRAEVIQSWLAILSDTGIKVINPPGNRAKYIQLQKLHQAGMPMPKTCVTSSPETAKQFIQSVGQAVCKPIRGGSYCRKVDSRILDQLDFITAEPVIFQEEIDGDDVRVNMLNGQVLSSHVIRKTEPGVLDYRTDPSYGTGDAEYEEVELPDDVIRLCGQAMELLGLRFSGIDLRRTADGYVLIECNSMPAYMDIELKTGAPITESLVRDMLASQPVTSRPAFSGNRAPIQPKVRVERGKSLFDYYDVMSSWQRQVQRQQSRQIIALNEEQIEQIRRETGTIAEFMEIEVREDGVPQAVRVF